jgi:GNAT superfamily N-acetyltransferase
VTEGRDRLPGAGPSVSTVGADGPLDDLRALFREYVESIPGRPPVPDFDTELRGLPGKYVAPTGTLLLARLGSQAVGCAGVRPFDEERCELKRLYVRTSARGHGLGRVLVEGAVEFAERAGYQTMLLDTLPAMVEALALYDSFGFREIPPYWANPAVGVRYFSRSLRPRAVSPSPRGTSK